MRPLYNTSPENLPEDFLGNIYAVLRAVFMQKGPPTLKTLVCSVATISYQLLLSAVYQLFYFRDNQ